MSNQNKLMIIIAGNAGHGKSTLEEMLEKIIAPWAPVRTDAYAYTLKKIAHESLGVPWHTLNAPKDVKESTYVSSWGGERITVRQALQDIGEWFRQRFGHLIWANSVKQRAEFSPERVTIVSDARHPKEEVHWMREHCSEFARVFVARIRRASVPINRGHPSEDFIADEPDGSFEFVIENDGDIDELRNAALELACACVFLSKTGRRRIRRDGDGWLVADAERDGYYEPLTDEDALTWYKGTDVEPRKVTYYGLKGTAVG